MNKSPFRTGSPGRAKKALNTMELGHLVERTIDEHGKALVWKCRDGEHRIAGVEEHRVYPPGKDA